MQEKVKSLKISRKILYVSLCVVVVLLIAGYFGIDYYKEKKWSDEVNSYKKLLYESTLCQYSCPLEQQTLGNSSLLLPSQECVTGCLDVLRNSTIDVNAFSNNDLMNDGLILDIQDRVIECKKDSINMTTERERAERFVGCVGNSLGELKETYNYLG